MSFSEELEARIAYAEKVIYSYIPQNNEFNKEIIEAISYSLTTGGKRLRPVLINSIYRLFNGKEGGEKAFMAAMEMLHTYSLVHDDLPAIDNDDVRRGMPTCHVKFGEAIGILSGDGLLHLAYETAIKSFDENPDNALAALRIFGEKTGISGMFGGQSSDVINTGKELSDELLYYIYENKTGALIEGAMMIGGALAGVNDSIISELRDIGALIGMAFQIRDDILDEYGEQETFGKPIHSDDRNNKKTYLSINGYEKSQQDVFDFTDKAITKLENIGSNDEEREFLKELFRYLVLRNI